LEEQEVHQVLIQDHQELHQMQEEQLEEQRLQRQEVQEVQVEEEEVVEYHLLQLEEQETHHQYHHHKEIQVDMDMMEQHQILKAEAGVDQQLLEEMQHQLKVVREE
jgi:hypothetical protein